MSLSLTASVAAYSLYVNEIRFIHLSHYRVYDHTFQNTFLAASVAVQPLHITIRNMSRCEKQLPLSNLEANPGLTASVITPLKFRKLFLQTALKTGPESKQDKGDDKHFTGRLFVG